MRPYLIIAFFMLLSTTVTAQRRINPVTPQRPGTTPTVNVEKPTETEFLEVDTLQADTAVRRIPPMVYPLMHSITVGVDLWDPIMRAFGQKYGLAGIWGQINLHNRYLPTFETGLGACNDAPSGGNFRYHSPAAPYFKLGCDYNFLYNSDPDYLLMAGLRYGFSAFKYNIDDITLNSPYWDDTTTFSIPSQSATAGWIEVLIGMRAKLAGGWAAGWQVKFHKILHEGGRRTYGDPMYIPGYGKRGPTFTGQISLSYTFSLDAETVKAVREEKANKKKKK